MAQAVKKAAAQAARAGGEMTIRLSDPGMTALHRVGLAGLYMTLKALEAERGAAIPGCGSWELTGDAVTLRWKGDARTFFDELLRKSFRVSKHDLFWFPGLGDPADSPQHAVVLQEALLGTFLQHGKTRHSDPADNPGGSIALVIDDVATPVSFHRVRDYSHQNGEAFRPDKPNELVGWLYPGGADRHAALSGSTKLEDSPERTLALWFAPVGAIYFEVRRRGGSRRPHYALVIPDVADLAAYQVARRLFLRHGIRQFYAAGTSDAGLRVLAMLSADETTRGLRVATCRVIAFGKVSWNTQQRVRVSVSDIHAGSAQGMKAYESCLRFLSPQLVRPKDGGAPWWDVMQVPDLVAGNVSAGNPWWQGFSDFVADAERRKHVFGREKGGLSEMVSDRTVMPDGPERTFVAACHEAWRRRLGQIGEKARREGSSFRDQARREFESTRVAFARCKNAATLREAVTAFWARAGGPLPGLQDSGWHHVLPLIGADWKKGRDLVLLALASYRPQSKEEEQALEPSVDIANKEEE